MPPWPTGRLPGRLVKVWLRLRGCGFQAMLTALVGRQVLHVEQEVLGDATTALESLLACDTERTALLKVCALMSLFTCLFGGQVGRVGLYSVSQPVPTAALVQP